MIVAASLMDTGGRLAQSMREVGFLQPVVIPPKNQLVVGSRRHFFGKMVATVLSRAYDHPLELWLRPQAAFMGKIGQQGTTRAITLLLCAPGPPEGRR
jgi:hypothetical protein